MGSSNHAAPSRGALLLALALATGLIAALIAALSGDRSESWGAADAASCENGDGAACWRAFEFERNSGSYGARDARERSAAPLARRACELGIGAGCAHLAWSGLRDDDAFSGGDGIPSASTRQFAERGCDLEAGSGCYYLGMIHEHLGDDGAAHTAWTRGCDGTSARSCLVLAEMSDPIEDASGFYVRACEMSIAADDTTGCVLAADAVRASDPTRALVYLDHLCGHVAAEDSCALARRMREAMPAAPGDELVPPGAMDPLAVGSLRLTPPPGHRGVRRGGGASSEVVVLLADPDCTVHWSTEPGTLNGLGDLGVSVHVARQEGASSTVLLESTDAPIAGRAARTWRFEATDVVGRPRGTRILDFVALQHGGGVALAIGSFPAASQATCRAEMESHLATVREAL